MKDLMTRQKRIMFTFFFVLILAATRSSAQDNPMFRHLPPNATSVFHVNIPVITGKMNWQELMGSIPPGKKNPSSMDLMAVLKDPAKAGMDISRDVFFTETRQTSPDSAVYTSFLVHLLDSAKFSAFLRNGTPGIRIVSYPGKIRSAAQGNVGVAWNKELAVIVSVSKSMTGGSAPVNATSFAARRSLASLAGYDKSFYTTDPTFKAGFSDDADIQVWTEQGNGLAMLTSKFMKPTPTGSSPFATAADQQKGKSLIAIRFEAGKITFRNHVYPTAEMAARYAQYKSRPMDVALLARVPKGNLLGFISFSIDLLQTADAIKKYDTRHKIDSMLASKHLSLDTIMHAFKGDIQLAALEPEMDSTSHKPKVPVFLVIPINDMTAFNSIAADYKSMQDSAPTDSSGQKMGFLGKMKLVSGLKNNLLVISTGQEYVDAYLGNTDTRSTDFLTEEMKRNTFNLMIDFRTLADFFHHMSAQPSGKDKKMFDILDALDKLVITAGVKDGRTETYFELKLMDQGQNSLKTLVQLMH
ncbi:MAG TPA: DUF4836 family protein [Puia sp.]|nr:DUF4836 family protein [Puia sp.]